jgi:hypothetical protein
MKEQGERKSIWRRFLGWLKKLFSRPDVQQLIVQIVRAVILEQFGNRVTLRDRSQVKETVLARVRQDPRVNEVKHARTISIALNDEINLAVARTRKYKKAYTA